MKPDSKHIKKICVVSNTHWDREFRRSFEKTRRGLVRMLDTTIDILENDPNYHSFTLDGHSILIEDYLGIRPEMRERVSRLIREGRLIAGPWYTLVEQFSVSHEALARNFLWGKKTVESFGGSATRVAYTPASWGQTGQLPQILANFGLEKMMFYRGISHHEADAEYVWQAPDGTQVLASRFAVYARYNWYYQVHRPVTRGRVFEKDYIWGEFDDAPFRSATNDGDQPSFDLKAPALSYDPSRLRAAISEMLEREGGHFTAPIFLAMHGHDISVAHPLESQIICNAQQEFGEELAIQHTDLDSYWDELTAHLNRDELPVLIGERRAYLKTGMWTYLFPGTISARTYLKQMDFNASTLLVYNAEPLAALAHQLGAEYPSRYLDRGWSYLLSNHTHDANGGCAPDAVCLDMEYRYRKVKDLVDIAVEDAMAHIARNLAPAAAAPDVAQLVVFNPLPFSRSAVLRLDVELPRQWKAGSILFTHDDDVIDLLQPISSEPSSVFVDSIWDVPTILNSQHIQCYAWFENLPALGYRAYRIEPQPHELRPRATMVTGHRSMENEFLAVEINVNGSVNLLNKATGRWYRGLNFFIDQGETGNAWKHVRPTFDRLFSSEGQAAGVSIVEQGPLVSAFQVQFDFPLPVDYGDGKRRSDVLVNVPIAVIYRLERGCPYLKISVTVDNRAKDHWLRAAFPSDLKTEVTVADSHFDIVSRPIAVPDSTGWVEEAGGTHPLRTFVAVNDGVDGLAVLSRGLFEYEALEDGRTTLLLTLIRACRIKLAVSEEKQTEIADVGIQCPGVRGFEYALLPFQGDWRSAGLLNLAADYIQPTSAIICGRGKGDLPHEAGLFSLNNLNVHVTCVKKAENGDGLVIRFFNPLPSPERLVLQFGRPLRSAFLSRMDETEKTPLPFKNHQIELDAVAKKIITVIVNLE